MTHKEIFTKFMIEYDKANVTSSYPSLTEYEVATFLDKAYMALIAQKVTGNNVRKAPLETDVKGISDLHPLIKTKLLYFDQGDTNITIDDLFYDGDDGTEEVETTIGVADKKSQNPIPPGKKGSYTYQKNGETKIISLSGSSQHNRSMPDNVRSTKLPDDMLYFVSALTAVDTQKIAGIMNQQEFGELENIIKPMDNKDSDYNNEYYKRYRAVPVMLTSHQIAQKFFATAYNIPWVKTPMCYIENDRIFVVADPVVGLAEIAFRKNSTSSDVNYGHFAERLSLTYVKKPHTFVKDLNDSEHFAGRSDYSYFNPGTNHETDEWYQFELNDVVAEELISIAITYALENVESQRLTPHVNLRGLES